MDVDVVIYGSRSSSADSATHCFQTTFVSNFLNRLNLLFLAVSSTTERPKTDYTDGNV